MSRFVPPGWVREVSAPFEALQGELNRLFEDYCRPDRPDASRGGGPVDLEAAVWAPPYDLDETPRELIVRIDLPGVDPARVDLSLTGEILTVRGEKPTDAPPDSVERARERTAGTFLRHVTLPEPVAFDRAQAESKHGVLTVRLPKLEAAKPRTIPIRTG